MKLLIALCLLLINLPAFAELTAKTDKRVLSSNESLRLIVESDDLNDSNINFTQLEKQFEILNQQSSSRQQIINGRVSASRQWVFILSPKATGKLLIPSFELNGKFSNAIEITVRKARALNLDTDRPEVLLKLSTDKNSVYVQEQILLTVQLFYRIPLNSYEAQELSLKDATVEKLADKNYTSLQNGTRYNILEITYTIHPQASGMLTIPGQRWRLERPSRNFFDSRSPYLFVQSEAITVEIKPIPEASTAKHWLPSTALTLEPNWKTPPLAGKAGEPINYELILTGNGLSASQLPEIKLPPIEGLKYFSEKSETNTIKSTEGIISTRASRFTIIPEKGGEFTLPEISIKWWNTQSDQEQTLTVAAQKLSVLASQLAQNQLPSLPDFSSITDDTEDKSNTWVWQLLSATVLLLGVIFLFFTYSLLRNRLFFKNKDTYGSSLILNTAYKNLQQAINENNLHNTRKALLDWSRLYCQQDTIQSLTEVGMLLPDLKSDIEQLNHKLYNPDSVTSWQAKLLLDKINKLGKVKNSLVKTSALKELYPSM